MMDFASSRMNGIVWLPDSGSKAYLALTNASMKAVHVNLSVGDYARVLFLRPRETRVLKLDRQIYRQQEYDTNPAGRAVLVRLSHDGAPGDIIGTGFVLNPGSGYSSDFALVDPATSRTAKLAGAGVRFGYADVTEGFPVGTKFRAPLVLANVGTKPVMARVSVDFTLSGTPTSLGVSEQRIMPGELKIVELTKEMAKLGVTGPVDDAGVDVSYTGAPGSLIGHLTSEDQTGDYAFVVPIKDPDEISHMSGNTYPWSLENGDQTVLHLKNTTDKPVWVMVQIRFEGGSYNPDRIQLQPFQTVNLDIQKLKDSKQKDLTGNIIPKIAMHGQVEWIEETPGSMIGRAERTNIAAGTARSFSCTTCPCDNDFYDATMTPATFTGPVGGSGNPFRPVYRTEDCNGDVLGPYSMSPNAWSSTNSSVASVTNTGHVSCLAGGTATIGASMNYDNYYYTGPYNGNQCVAEPFTPQTGSGGNMTVIDMGVSGNPFIYVGSDSNMVLANIFYVQNHALTGAPTPSGGTASASSSDPHDTFKYNQGNVPTVVVTTPDKSTSLLDRTLTFTYTVSGNSASVSKSVTAREFAYLGNDNPSNTCSLGYGTDRTYTYTVYTEPDKAAADPSVEGTAVAETFSPSVPCGTVTGDGALNQNAQFSDHVAYCGSVPLTCSGSTKQTLKVGGFQVRTNTLTFSSTGVGYGSNGPTQ